MKRIVLALALGLCATLLYGQERQWAVVNVSDNFMRHEPDYESGNDTQCLMGTVVEVLDQDRYWCKVSSPDPYVAWTNELTLAFMTEDEKDAYVAASKFICVADYTYVYESPSTDAPRVCDLTMGNLVRRTGVSRRGWTCVLLPSGRTGWVMTDALQDFLAWAFSRKLAGENICALASKYLGVPYMWGGTSVKGFDCSGLVRFAYFMHGVLLPRDASQQAEVGAEIPVDMDCWLPGDLLFFGTPAKDKVPARVTHVAIYAGNGRIVQASQLVRSNSLIPGSPDFYDREVLGVRRIIGHVDTGEGAISITSSPYYFKGFGKN